ncbi:MAG: HDOD domain-containing protein [Phycisphaeraceae bacterium]|nr:HDOD domain-containing protein [Phycisphaeraceae bacterium]
MNQRDTIIQTASSIEAMPPLALELIDMLQSPDAEVGEVAHVIAHDPSSAANLLKLANSAAMAPRSPVTEIKQAVIRIGLQRTAQLVLHGVVAKHIDKPITGYDLVPGALWEFSAAAAIATHALAKANESEAPPQAFTAGLFQDLGKLVLGHFVRADGEAIRQLAFEQGHSFEQAEREVLGIDHAEVGAILLESWGISGAIHDAVRWHHEPENAPEHSQPIAYLVHVAGQIVNLTGIGGGADGSQHQPSGAALDFLDIQPKRVEQVMRETLFEFENLKSLTTQSAGSKKR